MKESNCSSPSVVSTVADVTGGGRDRSGSGTNFSTTKRETVMLPKFSGDEKTAFLKYSITQFGKSSGMDILLSMSLNIGPQCF